LTVVAAVAGATLADLSDEVPPATINPARTGNARSAKRNLVMFPPGEYEGPLLPSCPSAAVLNHHGWWFPAN
jgi:hypothetical protein